MKAAWGAGPDDDASQLAVELSGRVVTAALDRPQRIGGWDSRKHRPLALAPFAPAGTVWWIEDTQADTGLIQIGDTHHTRYGHGMAFVRGSA